MTNNYETTWPHYEPGGPVDPDLGGPGTLYTFMQPFTNALKPEIWAMTTQYNDFSVAAGGMEVNNAGNAVTFTNVNWISGTPVRSDDQTWTAVGNTVREQIEVDKNISLVTFDSCTLHQITVQSQSSRRINITDSTMDGGLNGTGHDMTVTGSTIGKHWIWTTGLRCRQYIHCLQ